MIYIRLWDTLIYPFSSSALIWGRVLTPARGYVAGGPPVQGLMDGYDLCKYLIALWSVLKGRGAGRGGREERVEKWV